MSTSTGVRSWSEEELERLRADSDDSIVAGETNEAGADVENSISTDELFHLLQNARRRAVIRYLRGREDPVRMRDVAEQIAAWEHDTTVAQLTSKERQRVYISLYQSHLETMADAGVIEYNKPRGVIEPQPLLDHVASYLDRDVTASSDTAADEDPWLGRYLGAAGVSTLLFAAIALDLAVFELLPGIAAGVIVLLLFTGLTVAKLTLDGGQSA